MGKEVSSKKKVVTGKNNKPMDKDAKRKKLSIICMMIVVLALVIAMISLILNFVSKGKKNKEVEDPSYEEVEVDPNKIIKRDAGDGKYSGLLNKLTANGGCYAIEAYANNHKVEVSSISNLRAFQMAGKEFYSLGNDKVSVEEFTSRVKNLLGSEYEFNPDEIDYSSLSCLEYKYDSSKKQFKKQKKSCSEDCSLYSSKYRIIDVFEQNNQLFIDVKVLFGSNDEVQKFYADYGRTIVLSETANNSDYYFGQATTYRFVFKNESGRSVFVSSEPIYE